jgi:RNA polymerase sigma factor (sigma-70 family)
VSADAKDFFTANLSLIERVIRFVCRKNRLELQDQDDFTSAVMLRLMENDYAIIRKFEGRSTFAAYITSVTQRLFLDLRIQTWGKWHASAEATRLGDAAVLLERLLFRDGHPFPEAVAMISVQYPELTQSALETLLARLPLRTPRQRMVELTDAASATLADKHSADISAIQQEQRQLSARVSTIMNSVIATLPEEDQTILRLRFECDMNMVQIARSLHAHEKQIRRRFQKHLQAFRTALERGGLAANEILAAIGENGSIFEFPMSAAKPRPSTRDEAVPGIEEVTP